MIFSKICRRLENILFTRTAVGFQVFSFYNAWITSANIMTKKCCDDTTHSIETFQKDQRLLKISVDYFESIINRIFLDSNFEKVFQWFS